MAKSTGVTPKHSKADLMKALASINKMKEFSDSDWVGAVLMSDNSHFQIDVIKTWSLWLDNALWGGFARGRIAEIYWQEASWKTTIALNAAVECQKLGGYVWFIDAEQAFNKEFAKSIGLIEDQLVVFQPDNGEQGFEMARQLIATGMFDMIIIDSVSALVPKSIIDGSVADQSMGTLARMMSKGLSIVNTEASKSKTAIIFINQIRDKIGVMYGNPQTTSWGNALKYYCTQRLEVKRIEKLMDKETNIGNRVRCIVQKNKIGAPFKRAEFNVMFNYNTWDFGVDTDEEIFSTAVELGVIAKDYPKKSYYTFPDWKEIFGEPKAKAYCLEPAMFAEIKDYVTGVKIMTNKKVSSNSKDEDIDEWNNETTNIED